MSLSSFRHLRPPRRLVAVALCAACILLAACGEQYIQSSLSPRSDTAIRIDALFRRTVWLAAAVFVLVEGALLVALFRFRERPGGPLPAPRHGHTALEIGWTVAPAIVLVLIAVPTVRTIWELDRPPRGEAMPIEVIGHQWWWEFRYPELGITTANELHIPTGRTVDLHLTSSDVIHSFWLPRASGKRDVIPGHETRLWFRIDSAGIYAGQCAEFCGLSHALMGMRLIVQEPDEFQAWADRMRSPPPQPPEEVAAAGRDLFMRSACVACHTIEGTPAQGRVGPALTGFGGRTTLAAGMLENTPENLAAWLRSPAAVKPGALMPALELTVSGEGPERERVAALVAYLRSLR